MTTTTKPADNNATATRKTFDQMQTLTSGIFKLTDHDHIGKAEGVLRLASWMFGAITTLDTIRAKAEWCDRLAHDLEAESIDIGGSVFTIEHATAMQAMLLDAAHTCSQTQTRMGELSEYAQVMLHGGAP
ncbi:hypothetical protein [Rhodoferax sp.]|uniref:hypothetical protein n=1 Tax=Rhodoferax sp. TaxID=50421 RepID=UPI0025D3FDAB|nr:hypothetical protein [Rhodoferax sp.]